MFCTSPSSTTAGQQELLLYIADKVVGAIKCYVGQLCVVSHGAVLMGLQACTNTGSISDLAWTADGTQLAGAGANGHICFAQVIGLTAEVGHIRATLTDKNSIEVYHLLDETVDELDFRDRVIKMCLGEPLIITHPMMVLNVDLQHCVSRESYMELCQVACLQQQT